MALSAYASRLEDEKFVVDTPNKWPATHVEFARSSLLRWIWVGTMFAGGRQGRTDVYLTDDFGHMVEVKYIQASVAGSKDPI